MNIKQKSEKIKQDIPAVYFAMKMKSTPWYAKFFACAAIAYALSPIDLIPDFIPLLGYLDDVIILPGLIALAVKSIPDSVMEEARIQSKNFYSEAKGKWYYSIPVVLIWLLIICLIVRAVIR